MCEKCIGKCEGKCPYDRKKFDQEKNVRVKDIEIIGD